jgi:hypothetical protein
MFSLTAVSDLGAEPASDLAFTLVRIRVPILRAQLIAELLRLAERIHKESGEARRAAFVPRV